MKFAPYSFAFDDHNPPLCMDRRHVEDLHNLAMRVPKRGIVVEIGCGRGASTSAFVEALNTGADFQLHVVDPSPRPEFNRVIALCSKIENIVVHQMRSENFRLPACDLWFIDGDHGWPAVADCMNALVSKARVIAMHDTRSYMHGMKDCFGSYLVAEALRADTARTWDEDAVVRRGEWTHRGFGVSTAK
jgi:hypothetical protein